MHLLFKQALVRSQSELVTHSGLHPVYGSPKYSGIQVQEPAPFLSLHLALAPQGDGLHGVRGSSVVNGTINNDTNYSFSMLKIYSDADALFHCFVNLPSIIGMHSVNGSPVYPGLQTHTGLCLITLQRVLTPQDPGQGSLHCIL